MYAGCDREGEVIVKKQNRIGTFRITLDHVIKGQDEAKVTAAVVQALILDASVAEMRMQRHEFTVFCTLPEDDFSPTGLRKLKDRLEKLAVDARDAAFVAQAAARVATKVGGVLDGVTFNIEQEFKDHDPDRLMKALSSKRSASEQEKLAYEDPLFPHLFVNKPLFPKPSNATDFICSGNCVDVWFYSDDGKWENDTHVLVVTGSGPQGTWNRDELRKAIERRMNRWSEPALAALNQRYPEKK